MALKMEKNLEFTKRFNDLFPGGHTNFKVPIEATKNRVFCTRAEGSRVWDSDGNEFIDFVGGLGPNILGHRHPEWIKGLRDFIDTRPLCTGSGVFFTEEDILVAEKIVKHVPCAEKVKFCVSGSEAVQTAIRLARAHTKRSIFIRFSGHYHGWLDNVIGGVSNPNPIGRPYAIQGTDGDWAYTEGTGPGSNEQSFMLPWSDIDALKKCLETYGEEVALIHFEGIVCNHFAQFPKPGFLEEVRKLCDQYGIVMSMDEVITGFRVGINGAQGLFGVTPDIATFGKAMSGGLPISCVAGKTEIMDQLKTAKVLGPGTFNGSPLCVKAVLECIKILEKDNGAVYKEMDRVQRRLMDGLGEIAKRKGLPLRVQGPTGAFFTLFGCDPDEMVYTDNDMGSYDIDINNKFFQALAQEGVYLLIGGRWYMTLQHTDKDVDEALARAEKAMSTL